MGVGKYFLLVSSLASVLYISHGCQMDGVGTWLLTQEVEILDTYRGTFWSRATTNIDGVSGITVGGAVNFAPYLDVNLNEDGLFTISTISGYELYEENETSEYMSFTVNFACTGGTSNSLIFSIKVEDTNNNPPTFRPTDRYEFNITPPLPPGFQIAGCVGDDIVVRDIDLTTSRIDFTIEENPYFEISYEGRSSTDPKEFLASLKTKDLIRNLSEDLELNISATDVDATQDPRLTTYATITIKADESFRFPEEPVFSQAFYMATYTDNQVVLEQSISLQQGYDAEVVFSLEGEHSDYFEMLPNGNTISIEVSNALSSEILRGGRVILVVRAEREYTSGATAAVIIRLPEVVDLEFEQMYYESTIVDNALENLQLTLTQGYEESFNIELPNEYSSYFSTSVQGNVITLSMPTPLTANVINENNFIALQVVASNAYSTASAIVILDIVKDDNVTPAFVKAIYTGEYDSNTGLDVEQISLEQGYDETVSFYLDGVHSEHFSINNDGPEITLTSTGIPTEIWTEQQVLLVIRATKPRTVTATTAVFIQLPTARQLSFEEPTYIGTLRDGVLNLSTIVLSMGFAEDVAYNLNGEYASYFTVSSNAQNQVNINLSTPLPDGVILENNFLALTLSASGSHAVPTSTTIILEIIKQDFNTPAFTENIYTGSYLGENSIEIGNISLAQGYDSTVTFRVEGEHSQYFQISNDGNSINVLPVSSIPLEVIFQEKVLFFSILAEKPLSVGANAAVTVIFPQEMTDATVMRFSQNTYAGSVENNVLALGDIVLEDGYESGTEFYLSGEYASYFLLQNTGNIISISIENVLPEEIEENYRYVVLEVTAIRERAVTASASIVIDIVKEDIVPPAFSNAYYKSVFANGLFEDLTITLSEGYDETVLFELVGDNSIWFSIANEGNIVRLSLNSSVDIPGEILENNEYFLFSIVASKPTVINASAAIFVHLPKETPETVLVRFSQTSYVGRIDDGELYAPAITLLGEREPINFNITGDYAQYFEVTQISASNVEIHLKEGFFPENIELIPFIVIDIEAIYPGAISGHTTVIFEVIKRSEIVTPVFDQAFYTGVYSSQGGLQFEQSIRLSQGFDGTVEFTLAGDDAQWFEIDNVGENNLTLSLRNNSLDEILDRSHLVFSVIATKTSNVMGNAAIIINFSDFAVSVPLRFEQNVYKGTIENNVLNVNNITLIEGFSPIMNISMTGDHTEYFQLTNQDGVYTLQLVSVLPSDILDNNNVLVFTLEAETGDARTHTTIVLELIKTELTPLAFEDAYYVGSYSIIGGFTFDPQITVTEDDDETASFSLEGDHSQYFEAVVSGNSVTLRLVNPIPTAVVMNNHHLIFTIRADKQNSITARATIVIALLDEYTAELNLLGFDRTSYVGSLENTTLDLGEITLSEGYTETVAFRLLGDLQNYFAFQSNGPLIIIRLESAIPEQLLPENRIIILELEASAPESMSAYATIIVEVIQEEYAIEQLVFSGSYYTGHYSEVDGLSFEDTVTLNEGYDESVTFVLEGDHSQYFEAVVSGNSVTLRLVNPIPTAVVMNNHHLIFTIRADKQNSITVRATIVIALLNEYTAELNLLGFDRTSYVGSLENTTLDLGEITLSEGYTETVAFRLLGDLQNYFAFQSNGPLIIIRLESAIPEQLLPENRIIILELEASAPESMSAYATIIVEVIQEEYAIEQLVFSGSYYTGHYSEVDGLSFEDTITLNEGYDESVTFVLEGDHLQYFEAVVSANSVSLELITPIPTAVVMNNYHLIFTIRADKPNAITSRATIVIALSDAYTADLGLLGFDRITYVGSLENTNLSLGEITLSEGYSETVGFSLFGDLENYFTVITNGAIITIRLEGTIPEQLLPENRIIILELVASSSDTISAHATIVLEVVQEDTEELMFDELYYTGSYSSEQGLAFDATIQLIQGYNEDVTFLLEEDHSQWFELAVSVNSAIIILANSIPADILNNNTKLIFVIVAQKSGMSTRAPIIISLTQEAASCTETWFEKVIYEGIMQGNEVQHETINVFDYNGTDIQLFGEYAVLFSASLSERAVTVQASGPVTLPTDVSHVALELRAGTASAVLLLDVEHNEIPVLPVVSFSSPSYAMSASVTQSGLVGRVLASADNGEAVAYSLAIDDAHLLQRVTVNNDGELYLSAPANSGAYSFQVTATTVFSRVSGNAVVHLTVEAVTICGDDYILPPLQILNRDEESPYENLVPLNISVFEGCRYSLINRWPVDQSWLYVDESGLHAHAIDREHDSIAFMALSQVQVELILQCDSDNQATRNKRSASAGFVERLGPYDYGNSDWILTDSISYNPRRSLVNLIVNDINDNYPIFIGKEDEPIVVGYPVPDLEQRILPRALAEVQATDADVGENAALVYWSTDEILAVSPSTGSIHVRDIAGLENDAALTVHATDRNGQGLTGSLDLLVKLVDTSHIAVITINGAFLDDEKHILNNLTAAVGYKVKVLRSSVISEAEPEETYLRKKREAILSPGASLQLYVYGLIEREPVSVERLTEDINTNVIETVIITSTVSLEDHLENLMICPLPGRDIALFVSTIVLAVLLFILIVAASVWIFLKWRKKQKYEEFSDENSLASRNDSLPVAPIPKPEQPTPRMNIEDLKRSERRLQEMLDAPADALPPVAKLPAEQILEKPVESKVNIQELPRVIQSFDRLKDADESDDDEFGERLKNRRKSVVTFNENVEKIIHVEEPPEDSDFEVYRL